MAERQRRRAMWRPERPVGAGVYGAITTRKWRYERVPPERWNLPLGFSFTRAEGRVIADLIRFATPVHTSGTAAR